MSWREQWDRVLRWFTLVEETNSGRKPTRPHTDYYQDELYAFFQNCYHLKDWLKNDPVSKAVTSDVEGFVTRTPSLSLCADLANGSKHLTLTSPRVDAGTRVGRRHYELQLGGEADGTIAIKYEVDAGGKTYDAFTLASECCDAWSGYLTGKGLV